MSRQQDTDSARHGGIQVIARAARIMRALGNNPQGLSLAAIAQEVDLPRSTVQRIIHALAEELLVEQAGPAGGVRLGPALGQLINHAQTDIISLTRSHLQSLSEQLQESVSLCSLAGDKVYVIDRIVAERELRVVFPIGVNAPLYATGAGKILLAEMPEATMLNVLPEVLPEHTPGTLSRDELLVQVEEARRSRFAADCDELIAGVSSCAVALDTYLGLYGLSVIGPTSRIKPGIARLREALLQCKQEIERAIGHSPSRD